MSRTGVVVQEAGMPLLLRILYFFLFGWWATGVWINAAWFLNLTIIGLPLGVWMLNRVPQVLTLRPTKQVLVAYERGEQIQLRSEGIPQHPWLLRLIYFVLIGWWLSWLWANAGWIISLTIIGLPLGIWMLNRVPAITTLMRT
ncbi:MAG TPA: YccF domain-containing protein [Anaerolineae bacterium]|nr:YccF domain-containing protein [Anaerolineae bacterium]